MKIYNKPLLPQGFSANGIACGLKRSGKLDLALLYSDTPARTAGLFTTNKIYAAPVHQCRELLSKGRRVQAILINSGNANCFTGKQGITDAYGCAASAAGALNIAAEQVLVSSTGIIGKRLAVDKIKNALPELVAGMSQKGIDKAAAAILTTDTFRKAVTIDVSIGNKPVRICAIAKGAGMIAPTMATMLAFILTDANVSPRALKKALRAAVDNSFNCITVDGCMSTNDSVLAMANGQSKSLMVDVNSNYRVFSAALNEACSRLAQLIIRDAEGATKFITIDVAHAADARQARTAALAIANSNLFKAAMYGNNPNFGRVVAAVGASGVAVREEDIKVRLSPLQKKDIHVQVNLSRGKASCRVYTSDLTPEYVKINAEYS